MSLNTLEMMGSREIGNLPIRYNKDFYELCGSSSQVITEEVEGKARQDYSLLVSSSSFLFLW